MRTRILTTLLLLGIAAAGLGTVLNDSAMQVHHAAAERAFYAFAVSKALNAVISMIQGTEISAGVVFVDATFSIGQVLDPLNDMIERFSWVMFAASISLGVQELLVELAQLPMIRWGLGLSAALLGLALWIPAIPPAAVRTGLRLLVVLALLRFAAIGFIGFEAQLHAHLMQRSYDAALVHLRQTQNALDPFSPTHGVERALEQINSLQKQDRLVRLEQRLEDAYAELIRLATVFTVESILLPMLFAWLMLRAFGWALAGQIDPQRLRPWTHRECDR